MDRCRERERERVTTPFKPNMAQLGGRPGLVVMGGNSCSRGREFESWHRILDGHFHIYFFVKIVICV